MSEVNKTIYGAQKSLYDGAKPYGRLAALPVAILDVAAGTVRRPLRALEILAEQISSLANSTLSQDASFQKGVRNGSLMLRHIAKTHYTLRLAPLKIVNQFVLFTLDPQNTTHSDFKDRPEKPYKSRCNALKPRLQEFINEGSKGQSRLLALPVAIASLALEILGNFELALFNMKESFVTAYGFPLKYVDEGRDLQKYTAKSTLQKAEKYLGYIAGIEVAITTAPIKLVHDVASILYDPENARLL